MADFDRDREDELMAIPRLAERIGVTPRVLRYWEEHGLISPTREHGKLRYSPRDLAIARLIRHLMDAGVGVEGVRMLKRLAEREVRRSSASGDEIGRVGPEPRTDPRRERLPGVGGFQPRGHARSPSTRRVRTREPGLEHRHLRHRDFGGLPLRQRLRERIGHRAVVLLAEDRVDDLE